MSLVINDINDLNLSLIIKLRQSVLCANVRARIYVSDQRTFIIDSAIMHQFNHPQLQFHINNNYIVNMKFISR